MKRGSQPWEGLSEEKSKQTEQRKALRQLFGEHWSQGERKKDGDLTRVSGAEHYGALQSTAKTADLGSSVMAEF